MSLAFRNRFLAVLCVCAVAASAPSVLPAAAVLLGQLDSDHEVVIASSNDAVEVRFHHRHEADDTDAAQSHQPGFEAPSDKSDGDHILRFQNVGDSVFFACKSVNHDASPQIIAPAATPLEPVVCTSAPIGHARPPPNETTFPLCLRSVVLLV